MLTGKGAFSKPVYGDIGVDDAFVYVGGQFALWRVPKGGGVPVEMQPGHENPSSFVVKGSDLFWLNNNVHEERGVWRMPRDGSQPPTRLLADPTPFQFLLVGDVIFWSSLEDDQVGVIDQEGNDLRILASAAGPQGLSYRDGWVYFVAYGTQQLLRVNLEKQQEVVSGDALRGSAADCTGIYWSSSKGMQWQAHGTTEPELLGPGLGDAWLTLDGTHIYSSQGRMPRGGGATEWMAMPGEGPANHTAMDATYVYGMNADGQLVRWRK